LTTSTGPCSETTSAIDPTDRQFRQDGFTLCDGCGQIAFSVLLPLLPRVNPPTSWALCSCHQPAAPPDDGNDGDHREHHERPPGMEYRDVPAAKQTQVHCSLHKQFIRM